MTVKALPMLGELHQTFGGTLKLYRAETDKWAEAHIWSVFGGEASALLWAIAPFLRLKREQALICIAFQSQVEQWREGHRANTRWPQYLRDAGERSYVRMKDLNAKGPVVAQATEQPFAVLIGHQWESTQASLLGPSPVSFPNAGAMRAGSLYKRPTLALATAGTGCSSLPEIAGGGLTLLPTPSASLHNDGESVESWNERNARLRLTAGNGNGMGTPLPIAVKKLMLLPTPAARDHKGESLPSRGGGVALPDVTNWGKYAPAIERHAEVFGRSAPAPVDDKDRLSARFVEWMQGYGAGHVTDRGISRTGELRMLGNSIVPLQAATAWAHLMGIGIAAGRQAGRHFYHPHGPRMPMPLLPTPQAHDAKGPKSPEQVDAMRARGFGVRNLNEEVRRLAR